MKTYKNLYPKLYSYENLFLAYKKTRKGKTKKLYVKKFEENLKQNLLELQKDLIEKTYKPSPLKKLIIRDPKTRTIYKSVFRDRIVHHAIVNILEPIFEPIFIYDSYASRKGKGHHRALKRFDYFKRKVSKNGKNLKGIKDNNYVCGYVFKADIKHYFDEVNHNVLIEIIKKKIKDNKLIWLIKQILCNYEGGGGEQGCGMPLGNYTSQFFANIYLNELDYFVKHKLKVKYYIRYVDDFVILHNSKLQLQLWKQAIDSFLKMGLKLELHPEKSKIIPLHKGVSFLGFRIFYYCKLLKKSILKQVKRNLVNWRKLYDEDRISYEKLIEKLEGWLAHVRYGNTYLLRKNIVRNFNKTFLKHSPKPPNHQQQQSA